MGTKGANIENEKKFLIEIKHRLQKKYFAMVKSLMNNDIRKNNKSQNKLRTYRTFKLDHTQEKYLTVIKDAKLRADVAKMRISDHNLMIEKGRHMKLDTDKRICMKCNLNVVEDEKHAITTCPAYCNERASLFNNIRRELENWDHFDKNLQFIYIMKLEVLPIMSAKFISHIINWAPTTIA